MRPHDARLFSLDAFGDRGRRLDGLRRHAFDALDRPVARRYGDFDALVAAVALAHFEGDRTFLVAADSEYDVAVFGD
jgi:hypothetical protein